MTTSLSFFLNSPHLSTHTRTLLLERINQEKALPQYLSPKAFSLLKIVCDDILPQELLIGNTHLNLAVMIDHTFASSRDGWRFAELPSDLEAYEAGLMTLEAHAYDLFKTRYEKLTSDQRGSLLDHAYDGTFSPFVSQAPLTPVQMSLWIRDVRADILSCFLSHPIPQTLLGLSANLTGGDDHLEGFPSISANERKPFEAE
ncbi:gluconate 2-dehydrogenase subunit 3 family protein [Saccharibacter sp. 17.LH.SD]|uniref:gluconate 2-dehydrogenase subunit 3 family protein n=1 Tax=Saccharibacter sp. 17.LH.SD TaxID=2689393 RepID=UPI00136F7B7E|nr:gluconate 2-dehydrogenase subunit 3 family protein [Saccharibacter sp. 17.LH.SD]MXV45138.1 gluconate 2-dehydrogenase subunit 3 family protein [Saccharibacter sp. 17.LH.SD]